MNTEGDDAYLAAVPLFLQQSATKGQSSEEGSNTFHLNHSVVSGGGCMPHHHPETVS